MQHEITHEILENICFFIGQECHAQGQGAKAEYWYNQALRLSPDNPELHYALSYICSDQKRFEEAALHSTYAMKGKHGSIAQYNRALALLMVGKYKQGFIDYDARLDFDLNRQSRIARFGDIPYWEGQPCDVLYITGEQGYGDIFQFCRYVPLVAAKFNVKKIYFDVPEDCRELLAHNFNSETVEVVSPGVLPRIDYQIQLVSLCRLFETQLDNIPPLLLKTNKEIDLKVPKGINVGLCWSGRKADHDLQVTEWNNRRSIELKKLEPLLSIEGINFISLQVGPKAQDIGDFPRICQIRLKDWSDTARLLDDLDLFVTVDSGPAHLAGAMHVPTILLNHASPCWRWLLEGKHTPWYTENLMQIRQKTDGDWTPVIAELETRLRFMRMQAA